MSNEIDNEASGFGGALIPTGGGSISFPLDLSLVDAGGTYTGVFRPGTLNGLIPSNYSGLTGIPKTGTVYIVLTATLSNGTPSIATFSTSFSPPSPPEPQKNAPPTTASILTHIVVDGTVLRVLGSGSPFLTCVPVFETDKAGPLAPGERNTEIWYNYILSQN